MLVSIIILTLNNWELTEQCLNSIVSHTSIPYELIVIDNGSTDGTQAGLHQRKDVHVIENKTNRGFAGGCNQGIEASKGDVILLLNNDTIVSRHWLDNLTEALYSSPDIGIVGPVSNMVIPMQKRSVCYSTLAEYHEFASRFNTLNPGLWRDTTALSGFCMLFRRELMDRIGYLDEAFLGGGFEDIDLGYRTLKAGLRLIIAGDTFVHHEGNASFRTNSINMADIGMSNRRTFVRKWNLNPERLIYTFDKSFLPAGLAEGYCHHRPEFFSLPNGILIRNSQGGIYQLEKGLKRPVDSQDTCYIFRFQFDRIIRLPDNVVADIPEGKPLLHNHEFPEHFPEVFVAKDAMLGIYLISHGVRYPFRDYESFCLLGYKVEETVALPPHQMESLTVGPPIDSGVLVEHELMDYRLYRNSEYGIYYAENGHLRPIPGMRELKEYGWHTLEPIPLADHELARYPLGPIITL